MLKNVQIEKKNSIWNFKYNNSAFLLVYVYQFLAYTNSESFVWMNCLKTFFNLSISKDIHYANAEQQPDRNNKGSDIGEQIFSKSATTVYIFIFSHRQSKMRGKHTDAASTTWQLFLNYPSKICHCNFKGYSQSQTFL